MHQLPAIEIVALPELFSLSCSILLARARPTSASGLEGSREGPLSVWLMMKNRKNYFPILSLQYTH